MSLQLKTELLFAHAAQSPFNTKLEFYLYNSLFGIPITHAALWDKSRNGQLEQFIVSDNVP
jgi:hypothetical protein